MTRVVTHVSSSAGWTLSADTDTPEGGDAWGGGRVLLAPLVADWAIAEVLPPVAVPSTVSLSIYDDGSNPSGWLPIDVGDAIGVYVEVDGIYTVLPFQGRVNDVSAVAASRGGMIFTAVLGDRLADLGSMPAPASISSGSANAIYAELAADAGIDFDQDENATNTSKLLTPFNEIPTEGMTVLDALNRLVSLDIRFDDGTGASIPQDIDQFQDPEDYYQIVAQYVRPRYLALNVDEGIVTPPATPEYRLQELGRGIDPDDDTIAGVVEFDYTAGARPWVLVPNLDYYDGSRTGLVFDATNVAVDLGEWRKTIQSAINTAEIQHADAGGTDHTTRRKHDDLVAKYGRVVRSIEAYNTVGGTDIYLAYLFIGRREDVASDYGFRDFTVAWETLSDDAKDAWASVLWPVYRSPQTVVYGRPVAISNVPADWLLSDLPVAGGRLIGAGFTFNGKTVRLRLSMTGVPPTKHTGLTYDGVAAIEAVEGHDLTFDTIDTSIRICDFGLVED